MWKCSINTGLLCYKVNGKKWKKLVISKSFEPETPIWKDAKVYSSLDTPDTFRYQALCENIFLRSIHFLGTNTTFVCLKWNFMVLVLMKFDLLYRISQFDISFDMESRLWNTLTPTQSKCFYYFLKKRSILLSKFIRDKVPIMK